VLPEKLIVQYLLPNHPLSVHGPFLQVQVHRRPVMNIYRFLMEAGLNLDNYRKNLVLFASSARQSMECYLMALLLDLFCIRLFVSEQLCILFIRGSKLIVWSKRIKSNAEQHRQLEVWCCFFCTRCKSLSWSPVYIHEI
jgi:hypothetical protein